MIKIDINKDCKGSLDLALKKYKNKVSKTKMLEEFRERETFTKKSIKKRQSKKIAIYKQKFKHND